MILHAGDISSPGVIAELERIAPVKAVRGNRDWLFINTLPLMLELTLADVPLVLMHSHQGMMNYLKGKLAYIRNGYDFDRYQKKLVKLVPQARVIVFGHTHHIENVVIDGQLWFNPGSASIVSRLGISPSIGVLKFYDRGEVSGEVIDLEGFRLRKGTWEDARKS